MKLQAIALATLLAFGATAFAQSNTSPSSPAGSAAQDQVQQDKDQIKQDKAKLKADKKAAKQARKQNKKAEKPTS